MNSLNSLKRLKTLLLRLAIYLASLSLLTACGHNSQTVSTKYVAVDLPSATKSSEKIKEPFKNRPPSNLLSLSSRDIRSKGTHNASGQIADLCLADFENLDIAFTDLVNEINKVEDAREKEREKSAIERVDALACLERLNAGKVCETADEEKPS